MERYEDILNRHYKNQLDAAGSPEEKSLFQEKYTHALEVLAAGRDLIQRIPAFKGIKQQKVEAALLLHDIGRFYQVRSGQFDADLDHGELGYHALKEQEDITDLSILYTVRVHDKITLDPLLDDPEFQSLSDDLKERILLTVRLVRDADKYANIYHLSHSDMLTRSVMRRFIPDFSFSEDVLSIFLSNKSVPRAVRRTIFDFFLSVLGWQADVYFTETRDLIRENKCFSLMLDYMRKEVDGKDDPVSDKTRQDLVRIQTFLEERGFI